jgi:hypothetical protein
LRSDARVEPVPCTPLGRGGKLRIFREWDYLEQGSLERLIDQMPLGQGLIDPGKIGEMQLKTFDEFNDEIVKLANVTYEHLKSLKEDNPDADELHRHLYRRAGPSRLTSSFRLFGRTSQTSAPSGSCSFKASSASRRA